MGKLLQGSNRVFFEGRENTPFENSFQVGVRRSSSTFLQSNRGREQIVKACFRAVMRTVRSGLHVPSGHRIRPAGCRNYRVRSVGCRICRRWSMFRLYDLTVCGTHTRLRVDSMMLLRLMMMGPLTIYPPNLEAIRREIVHHSVTEWLRLKLSILMSVFVGVRMLSVSQTSGPTQRFIFGRCHVEIWPGSWTMVVSSLERSQMVHDLP